MRRTLALVIACAAPAYAQQDPEPRCLVRGSHAWLSTRPSPLDSAVLRGGEGGRAAARVAKLCYSRPSARGRAVYGTLAPFGKAWRTGANEPTILELTAPAEVAGAPLAAGRYALLTVPGPERWVVLFHTFEPTDDAARIFTTMRQAAQGIARAEPLSAPVDTFTIRAAPGDGEPDGGAFLLEWGTLRARMPVRFAR